MYIYSGQDDNYHQDTTDMYSCFTLLYFSGDLDDAFYPQPYAAKTDIFCANKVHNHASWLVKCRNLIQNLYIAFSQSLCNLHTYICTHMFMLIQFSNVAIQINVDTVIV